MHGAFYFTEDHKRWARGAQRKYGGPLSGWSRLIEAQQGLCALSGAPLLFDAQSGTPVTGGHGAHPLYAAVDHVSPGRSDHGHQIVSYDLNDLKGHLPVRLFRALEATPEWRALMAEWKAQALLDPADRAAFQRIRRQ